MIQCICNVMWANMDCIGANTLSGDGGSNISWFLQHSALIPKHQHQDEHRLLHRKSSALWGQKMLCGNMRRWGTPPPLNWHKMQALPCRTCGFKGSARPFIIALLFLSLAGLLDRVEAPDTDLTSIRCQVLKTSTHLCFQPSVCHSAIWWVLDAQARLILWFRQNFFLPMFQNFYTIFLIFAEHIDALWEYCMTNLY